MKRGPELALKARLSTLPSIPKAWPNDDFRLPPVPTDAAGRASWAYIACTIVRAGTSDDTLDNTSTIVTGRMIASVVTLKGTGEARADQVAEQIAALFPMGQEVGSGGNVAQVMQPPHIREGITDGAYWRVPVSIPFEIYRLPLPAG